MAGPVTLSGDGLHVGIDEARGTLTVTDRQAERVWEPDPWLEWAGVLHARKGSQTFWWSLSGASEVRVQRRGKRAAEIVFDNGPDAADKPGWRVTTRVEITQDEQSFSLRVLDVRVPDGYVPSTLHYPVRPFSLRTDVDRGAAVIPFWQGVVIPSYIFPMNGGRFCMWDDAQHSSGAQGELRYYNWHGLVMPWFGTHDGRSAVMAVVPYDGSIGVQWIANYNNAELIAQREFRRSPYPRILSLTPVWHPDTRLDYHVLPGGNHVTMAKRYRQIAKRRGLFVSLEEKAKKNPDVAKLKGAVYTGIYGGYPHYVNLPGMAFTFDDLDAMVRDMHDHLEIRRALVHAWGTFSNYAPVMWPISEELGGAAKLEQVVSRIKGYGWLYSSYHSFVSLLDHDPGFNPGLAPKDDKGRPLIRGRWKAVDESRWADLARASLPREMEAIGQNADVTDIAFTGKVGEGGKKLADYLATTGLVLGTERGNEWLVPQFSVFEGLVATYREHALIRYSHPTPLFNLVYHDAVVNYGKIQDPNQLSHCHTGDYYVKSLRAMLHGDGPMVFFAPYEYEGVRPYLKFAAEFLCPLHESIAFAELVDHRFESPDFLVQSCEFAGGVRITVNLGPTPFATETGIEMPGYGFRIKKADGTVTTGRFRHSVVLDGASVAFE
jgi:hypothetical protein